MGIILPLSPYSAESMTLIKPSKKYICSKTFETLDSHKAVLYNELGEWTC